MNVDTTSRGFTWFSIFTSTSTLVCCALPATLVGLGAGASLVSLTGNFPQLIWLSEHKLGVFASAAVMLLAAGLLQWRARHAPCPLDPKLANACARQRRVSTLIYAVSVLLYGIGAFFAFAAPYLLS